LIPRKTATIAQKIEVLDWYHTNGKSQSQIAKHFDMKWPELDMKQPKVSDWIKKEAAI
jgi:transposase